MHLILTGGTGMIGYGVLQYCLASNQFDTSKARVIVHKDYTNYPEDLLEQLNGAQGIIWAQGTSQSAVNESEYIRITHDCPVAAAKAFATLGEGTHFNFVHVSGEGADPSEKAWSLYGRIKGRTEKHLVELPSSPQYSVLRIFNVRPGVVYPASGAAEALGTSQRPLGERIGRPILRPLIKNFLGGQYSPTDELSNVLVDLALGDGERLKDAPGIEADGRLVRSSACRTKVWESIFHAGRLQHSEL